MKAQINMYLKKILFVLIFSLYILPVFSDEYFINDIRYEITGKTRIYALQTKVKIDRKKRFYDEESLASYIKDIKKQIDNTRAFESVDVDYELFKFNAPETDSDNEQTSQSENNVYGVNFIIKTKDSLHFIGTPYPKYDSNSGFTLKIKTKDTNFLGSLETMSGDVNFAIEEKENEDTKYKFGLNFDFDIPFKLGPFESKWTNVHGISYSFGDSTPEWDLKTGLNLTLPFNKFSIDFDFSQSFIRNLDYEDANINGNTVHYGDGTYFIEDLSIGMPITIQEIKDWGKIYYKPFINANYNWDFDGISDLNEDLEGPTLSIGQKLSTSRVNWVENFRNGISVELTQTFAYNIQKLDFMPSIEGEFKGYKAFKHFGINTDIYAFAILNGTKSFGERLRGIRDEQYYSSDTEYSNKKACYSTGVILLNLDLPIKLFRIYWNEIPCLKNHSFVKYFNMELQASPFIDVALCHNKVTNTTFDFRDGFYAAGLELICYPLKWKGIQLRGSLGIDLGQKMPGLKGKLNQDWRDAKWYELTIGIGLHY